jgi:hypothetical protein
MRPQMVEYSFERHVLAALIDKALHWHSQFMPRALATSRSLPLSLNPRPPSANAHSQLSLLCRRAHLFSNFPVQMGDCAYYLNYSEVVALKLQRP